MNDLEAKRLVEKEAPLLTPRESLFLRVIAKGETSYARGWKDNSDIPGAVGDPKTSFNWGAINAIGTQPFFTYMDGLAVKEPRKFRVYSGDGAGIRDLSRKLYVNRRTLQTAILNGDAKQAVTIMSQKPIYFELPLAQYLATAEKNYRSIIKNTGEPDILSFSSTTSDLLIIAAIGGGIWAVNKWL